MTAVKCQNNQLQALEELRGKMCTERFWAWKLFNPLSPSSDKYLISPYSITTWSNKQIMRIKEMITNDQVSWFLIKFSQLVT